MRRVDGVGELAWPSLHRGGAGFRRVVSHRPDAGAAAPGADPRPRVAVRHPDPAPHRPGGDARAAPWLVRAVAAVGGNARGDRSSSGCRGAVVRARYPAHHVGAARSRTSRRLTPHERPTGRVASEGRPTFAAAPSLIRREMWRHQAIHTSLRADGLLQFGARGRRASPRPAATSREPLKSSSGSESRNLRRS